MDVAVTELRSHLAEWIARVRSGEEVVVTDRGVPVVRLTAVRAAGLLDRLTEEGRVARPAAAGRPTATGRARPRPRRPVADRVTDQRG